jgi:hypothetical protein
MKKNSKSENTKVASDLQEKEPDNEFMRSARRGEPGMQQWTQATGHVSWDGRDTNGLK